MKRLAIIPTAFAFVACLALLGCGDLTGPSLDGVGPQLSEAPVCVFVNIGGKPRNDDCFHDLVAPPEVLVGPEDQGCSIVNKREGDTKPVTDPECAKGLGG